MASEREQKLILRTIQQEEELRLLRSQLASLNASGQAGRPQSARQRGGSPPSPATPSPPASSTVLRNFPVRLLEPSSATTPMSCEGHSAVPADGRVVVFGGRNGTNVSGESWAYNVGTARWTRLPVTGSVPWGRYGHSAVTYKGCMFIFGGFGSGGVRVVTADGTDSNRRSTAGLLGSLYALDLQTKHWSEITLPTTEPCKGHSAIVHRGVMYLFGGCLVQGRTNAMRGLNLDDSTWSTPELLNPQLVALKAAQSIGDNSTYGGPLARSDIPAPRSGHCAAIRYRNGAGADSMVSFGGRLSKCCFANDAFEYNLDTMHWSRLYCGGTVPSPRSDHSGVVYKESLIVFGGYALEPASSPPAMPLDGDATTTAADGTAAPPAAPEDAPAHPDAAAAAGAQFRKLFYSDAFVLNLVSCTWSKIELTNVPRPLGLCGHSATLYDSGEGHIEMLIHGGFGVGSTADRTGGVHDDDVTRDGIQALEYAATNETWSIAVARAPIHQPVPTTTARVRPPSAARPSTARPSTAGRSRSPRTGKPSFSVQTATATTAKLFGEVESKPMLPAKRSAYEIELINKRLAYDDVAKAQEKIANLRRRFIQEAQPHKLTTDEQAESVDRLYYQQNEWRVEKARKLEEKWIRVAPPKRVDWEIVQDTVSRLTLPPEPKEVEPLVTGRNISKEELQMSVHRLYYVAKSEQSKRQEQLRGKYFATGPPKKLKGDELAVMLERLHSNSPNRTGTPRRR